MNPDPAEACDRFRDLFDAHYGEIWAFARNRTSGAADAEDIAAETFAIAWRRVDEVLAADLPRAWLFATARWVLANHLRARGRRGRLADRLGDSSRLTVELPDITERMLAEALARLSDDDLEVLLMRAWDGLSAAEMAVVLGCSVNAANIRLHRARLRLSDLLGLDLFAPNRATPVPRDSRILKDTATSGHLLGEPSKTERRPT